MPPMGTRQSGSRPHGLSRPAYVEAGKALRSDGQIAAAREIFAEGMELAALQGESHMRDHIQQQLDGLGGGER